MPITSNDFRDILDELKLSYSYDKENLSAKASFSLDDIGQDMIVYFKYYDNKLQVVVLMAVLDTDSSKIYQIMEFCNTWNKEKIFPKAYFQEENQTILGELTLFTDEEVSVQYITENLIKLGIATGRQMLEEAYNAGLYAVGDE